MSIKRSIRHLAVAMSVAAASTATASAGPIVYGITFDNELITIDPATGSGTLVGLTDTPMGALGLADVGGFLYALDQTADVVRKLDPATAHTVASINIGAGNVFAEGDFALRADGTGFFTDLTEGQSFHAVDVVAGTSHLIDADIGALLDAMAFSPAGTLYGYGEGNANLYTVDQTTGALTLVGNTGLNLASPTLFGMTFLPDGTLLLAGGSGSSGVANLYTVNTATGAATLVGNTGFDKISGLTALEVEAVPEPASAFLVVSGLVGVYARRRRGRIRN